MRSFQAPQFSPALFSSTMCVRTVSTFSPRKNSPGGKPAYGLRLAIWCILALILYKIYFN